MIVAGTLLEDRSQLKITLHRGKRHIGFGCSVSGLFLLIGTIWCDRLGMSSLLSGGLFMSIFAWFFATVLLTEQWEELALLVSAHKWSMVK